MTDGGKTVRQNCGRFLCLLLSLALCGQPSAGQSGSAKPRTIILVRFELPGCSDLNNCKELLHSLGVDDPSLANALLSSFTDQVLHEAQAQAQREGRLLNIREKDTDFKTAKAKLAQDWRGRGPSPDWIIRAVIQPLGPGQGFNIRLRTQRANADPDTWQYPHPCDSSANRLQDVVYGEAVKVGSELARLGKNILDSSDGQ